MIREALTSLREKESKVAYNERMSDGRENSILIHDMVDLFETDDFRLLEYFDSIELISLLIPSESHSPEGALE